MTTDLEKQFFDTFEIEPYDRYYNCKDNLEGECTIENTCCCCDKSEDVYCYPEITDRILLELICILAAVTDVAWREVYKVCAYNYEDLKELILDDCRFFKGRIKHQVQELFKEER